MEEANVVHNTFVIERLFPHTPERVFAALADPAKKRRWFAEGHSHEVEDFTMDFRVGGREQTRYRMNEKTPFPGVILATEGTFLEISLNRRIVEAASMTIGGRTISAALATFELLPARAGTNLVFTHQAAFFEGADGPKMREQGWRKLIENMAASLS